MSADVVSQAVQVNVRFRAWTPEDIKHNAETEYELLAKRNLKGIEFVIEDGLLVISKIKIGTNFDTIFVDYPKYLVMSVGDKILSADGKHYDGMKLKKKLESGKKHKTLLRFGKNANKNNLEIDMKSNIVSMVHPENNRNRDFQFDNVFDEASQSEVFERLGRPVVDNLLDGFNAAVFMYGQTGSGKTYTMFGKEMVLKDGDGLIQEEKSVGLVPRCIFRLMDLLHKRQAEGVYTEWKMDVTFLEVYRKKLANLLNPSKHQTPKLVFLDKQVKVANLPPANPRSATELMKLIGIAASRRTVSAHNMNASSSRSHMIMEIGLFTKSENEERKSKLVFADLAGSERVRTAKTKGKSLKEAQSINTQLMHLREAIKNLSHRKRVQWRDSMLTQIMKPVLMGSNCLTSVIVCASKRPSNRMQTWDTLTFGQNAKKIEVSAMKNRKLPREELNRMIEKLTKEKMELEKKLQSKAMQQAMESANEELQQALKRIAELEREIELVQSNVDSLTKESAQKDELNKELKYQNGELKERIRDLERQVEDVTHMEMAMQEMESQLGVLSEENEELLHKNEGLQREINQSKELRDALSEMTERFTDSAKAKNVENDKAFSMLSTLDKLAEAQNQLQDQVREENQKYEAERAEREKLSLELERLKLKLEEKDEQMEGLESELEKKDQDFMSIEGKITEYRREKEAAEARIEALTRENNEVKIQKAEAHRRAQTLMESTQIKVNELMMRDNQLEEVKMERELLKEQLEVERQQHREEFLEKQNELKKLEEEQEKKNSEQLELQQQIENLNNIRKQLIARNESLEFHSEEEKQKLLQDIDEISQNLSLKEKDLQNAKDILEETQAEQEQKDKELESLWIAHRKLDEEKQVLQSEKLRKEEEVISLQQNLQTMKLELEQTDARLQDLQDEISEKSSALVELEKEKENEQYQLAEMELMLSAMRQRQDIMKQQERELEASSAEAMELREKLAAAQEELNVKSSEVSTLKEHLATQDDQVERLNVDLLSLQSKQDDMQTQQAEMQRLQKTQMELGNVQDELDSKRLRVAQLESGMEVDKQKQLELSSRIEELSCVPNPSEDIIRELAEAQEELAALNLKLEHAEKEQIQHVLDVDRLEKTERELQKVRNLLKKKQEQLREAWRKGEEFEDMAIQNKGHQENADHAFAKLLQEKYNQESKMRKRKVRASDNRYNRRGNKKRNAESYAPGMGGMGRHDSHGGGSLPSSPRPIMEDYPMEGYSEIRPDRKPASVVQKPPRQHQIGKYKYTNEIRLGEQVRLSRPRPRMKGVVKWILEVPQGYELGIRLEMPVGDSDGSHYGKKYFDCEKGYGLFCNSSWVSHVLRPNDKNGALEKIRFENTGHVRSQYKRKASNNVMPEISQHQRTRLRKVLKQNEQLSRTVREAYKSADLNHDGSIQKEEFRDLCKRLKLEAVLRNPNFIDKLWSVLDVNGDNEMDEQEFTRFICDFMINEISPIAFKILNVKGFDEVQNDQLLADCLEMCLQKKFDLIYAE